MAQISEHRQVGSVFVTRHSIAGTRGLVVYGAYELSSYFGPHSSLLSIDGACCGSLASRRLPESVSNLPVGEERFAACDAFRAQNEEEAYTAIVAAYPEAARGERGRGEVEVWEVAP
jgi:hypothetical protein